MNDIEATKKLWLESRSCENTRQTYACALARFEEMGQSLETAQRSDITKYMIALKKLGKSPATINLRLSALSSFYKFAIRQEVIEKNPADVERLKVDPYGKGNWLDKDQARALLGKIDRTRLKGCRNYALFFGYLMTGLRNSAWRTAKWEDFERFQGKVYYTWSLKGHFNEKTLIAPPLWDALTELARATGKTSGYLFTAFSDCAERFGHIEDFEPGTTPLSMSEVNRILKYYAEETGLKADDVHVHALRHSAAMLRMEAGDDVLTISKMLNHKNIAVTQIYLDHLKHRQDTSWQTVSQFLGAG